MFKRRALVLLSIAFPLQAAAQVFDARTLEQAAQLRDRALADNQAYELVAALSAQVGPRLAGSAGDAEAVQWATAKLRELGFSNVRAEPVTVPRWRRGEASLSVAAAGPELRPVALGGSVATPAGGVAAGVLRVESLAELQALPPDRVKGRIVFFDARMERTRDGSGYGRAVRVRTRGPAEAGRRGAVGVVIRSAGTSEDQAHTGITRYDDAAPKIAAVALSNRDADALAQQLASDAGTRLQLRVTARELAPLRSANVVGEIAGQTDGIVLLAAHLDSWDLGTGANDDGAGVAIVTEAARLVGQLGKPRRTLRVVLYANEEFGLSGALEYVRRHAAELGRHALAMEADFGSGAVWRLNAQVPAAHWGAIEALAQLLAPLGVALGSNAAGGGADIGPQRERGVPVLEPVQDGTRYFDTHHTAADVIDNVDREGLKQNVAVYAVATYLAAEYGPGFGSLPVTDREPAR